MTLLRLFLYHLILISILAGHYYAFFKVPSEMYRAVTRSQTKTEGTQIPKGHRADKIVDPALKPKTQARGEMIPKPIAVIPKSVSQPQRIIPQVLPRKRQIREGARGKTIRPKLQPTTQPQPSPASPPIVSCKPELPPVAIPLLGGRYPPRQSRYKLPVCKDPVLLHPTPKPPDVPIDTVTPGSQPSMIEDGGVHIEAIEVDLNTDSGKIPHRKESLTRYLREQERNTCRKHRIA